MIPSVDFQTSLWWMAAAAGFCYFAYLAICRFLDGRTRARASIIAFSATWTVVAVMAVMIRTGWVSIHDQVTNSTRFAAAAALWWMILEFRRGNIRTPADPARPRGRGEEGTR